jgi:hypothetical protein
MTHATVKAIARFVRGVQLRERHLSVVWHAGEPLTAPIAFYDAAFDTLRSDAAPMLFQHHFQTNAMLIDDDCAGCSNGGPCASASVWTAQKTFTMRIASTAPAAARTIA